MRTLLFSPSSLNSPIKLTGNIGTTEIHQTSAKLLLNQTKPLIQFERSYGEAKN